MKYLKNRNTGVVFPYHEKLAKNKNMEPCNEKGGSVFEEVDATETPVQGGEGEMAPAGDADPNAGAGQVVPNVSENGIIIDKATKVELIKYAFEEFGVQLEDSQKVGELREQVKKLIEDDE